MKNTRPSPEYKQYLVDGAVLSQFPDYYVKFLERFKTKTPYPVYVRTFSKSNKKRKKQEKRAAHVSNKPLFAFDTKKKRRKFDDTPPTPWYSNSYAMPVIEDNYQGCNTDVYMLDSSEQFLYDAGDESDVIYGVLEMLNARGWTTEYTPHVDVLEICSSCGDVLATYYDA